MPSQSGKCVVVTLRCVFLVAKWAVVHPLRTLMVHVFHEVSPLDLCKTPIIVAHHQLVTVTVCRSVVVDISQVALPLTASSSVGALHLEVAYSSIVEEIRSCGEKLTIYRTFLNAFNTFPTEQVPTTGLHWVRDQLQTDGAL